MCKRFISIIVASFMLSVLFLGCSSQTPDNNASTNNSQSASEGSAAPSGEATKITFSWVQETDNIQTAWKSMWDTFHEGNPDIRVEMNFVPDINATLKVQLAGGGGPDLLQMDAFNIMEYAKAGYIVDLEPTVAALSWKDRIYDWAAKCTSYNGKMYGLPWAHEMTMVQVNKKLMEQLDLKVPTTREEFVTVCKAAQQAGYIAIAYGSGGSPLYNQWIYDHYINAYAGNEELAKVLRNEAKWTDEMMTGAFKMLKSDWDSGFIQEKQSTAISFTEGKSVFYNGKALFYPEGSAFPTNASDAQIENDKVSLGCYLWPSFRDGVGATSSNAAGKAICVNTRSKYQDAAIKALDFMVKNDEAVAKAVAKGVGLPTRSFDQSLIPEDATIGVKLAVEAMNRFPNETKNLSYAPWSYYPTKCNTYLYENMDSMLYGKISVEEYLQEAQAKFEEDLADGYAFAG